MVQTWDSWGSFISKHEILMKAAAWFTWWSSGKATQDHGKHNYVGSRIPARIPSAIYFGQINWGISTSVKYASRQFGASNESNKGDININKAILNSIKFQYKPLFSLQMALLPPISGTVSERGQTPPSMAPPHDPWLSWLSWWLFGVSFGGHQRWSFTLYCLVMFRIV